MKGKLVFPDENKDIPFVDPNEENLVAKVSCKDVVTYGKGKYKIVMWDVVTRDYSRWMSANDVFDNVKHYTRPGSILTFHDSLKAIGKLRTALPASIQWLKEQGYEFRIFE